MRPNSFAQAIRRRSYGLASRTSAGNSSARTAPDAVLPSLPLSISLTTSCKREPEPGRVKLAFDERLAPPSRGCLGLGSVNPLAGAKLRSASRQFERNPRPMPEDAPVISYFVGPIHYTNYL